MMQEDIAGLARVTVPPGLWPSMVVGASGANYPVKVDPNGDERFVMMTRDDARMLIGTPMPANLPWRQANEALLQQIGVPPKLSPGINIAAALAARNAAPRDPFDLGRQGP